MSSRKARESSLWTWVYAGTRYLRPALHLVRVENICEKGTPDVEGCYLGRQFHVELKAIARGLGELDTGVSDDQVDWHKARHRAGGRSWFLIQVGSGHGAGRYLVDGARAASLQRISEDGLLSLAAIPPSATPAAIIEALHALAK